MGNCLWGAPETVIKVIKSNGGIMEFYPPITVNSITNEFPGHGIFPNHDTFSKPLCQFDELVAAQSYYLLPLNNNQADYPSGDGSSGNHIVRQGHVRSLSVPTTPNPAPYRMSLDYQYYQGVGLLKRTTTKPFSCRAINNSTNSSVNKSTSSSSSSSSKSIGFWKVKLVITPEKLVEILSQEACTKELIESVRIVAKCGVAAVGGGGRHGGISSTTSIVSDQWSLSSSGRSAPSKIDALVVDI